MDRKAEKYIFHENYLDVAYWTINTYFPKYREDEDFFQVACIALMEAARIFKPEQGGKFSTLAVRVIKNRCLDEIRSRRSKKNHIGTISLNYIEKDTGKELIDMLADNSSDFENALLDDIYTTQLIEKLKSKLSEGDEIIFNTLNREKSYSDISAYVGLSKSVVYKRIKVIRKAYMEVIQEMGDYNETWQKPNKSAENKDQGIRA